MQKTKKLRVLIIDDEELQRRIIKAAVEKLDAKVIGEAENGTDGLEICLSHRPDFILLDMKMPGWSGVETLREILGRYSKAYIVMLTSVRDEAAVEYCMAIGAKDYILKNTPMQEVVTRLRKHFERILPPLK